MDGAEVAAVGAAAERRSTAALVRIEVVDPGHRRAKFCVANYAAELDRRGGFDPLVNSPADDDAFRSPVGAFLLATLRDEPVGCVGVRMHPGGIAEVKRMWVAPAARGLGIGRRLLTEAEATAVALGARVVQLDSNKTLTEAIALYRASGYRDAAPFNDNACADYWFEKELAVEANES